MLTDNMSWIAGYKSKKEEVVKDYDEIIKQFTQMNLEKGNPPDWNIEITTHKIRTNNFSENYNITIKSELQERNILLSTLTDYLIVYTDWSSNTSCLFYSTLDESQNESLNFFKTTPSFVQFLLISNSVQKAAQIFKISGSIFQLGDHVIKVGLYKKGMTNNLVIHFELKSLSFKKKPNFSLIDDPLMKDFLNYINFNNFKEKIIYRRLPPEISKYCANDRIFGSENNNFSWEVENLLEILDHILN